jgi:bifunctional UDP-N-acetylglucosamine pyrophosphorylase/glucosamine-1-phosphate N-acetyltransferase
MAAGHGKRIKSQMSKMLHKIWDVPTVVRVCRAAISGLSSSDQIVVVGTKACEVATCVGKEPGRRFVLQHKQLGTGHAVQVALSGLAKDGLKRDVYVFPGDKGLLDRDTVRAFAERFADSTADMMVLVSTFTGDIEDNSHGRIVRVPERDAAGAASAESDRGNIIEICELQDILGMDPAKPYTKTYRSREYCFSREALIHQREFNAGVYAFKGQHLSDQLAQLRDHNAQGEMYLTDLIHLFNEAGLSVEAAEAPNEEFVIGFNDKVVLHHMESIARKRTFESLKRIITICDKNDFFIADEVVEQILEMDRKGLSPDIYIGEGAHIGDGVKLSPGVHVARNARLVGNVHLGENVFIGESACLDTHRHQTMTIGANTEILQNNIVKGNVSIGDNCRIETTVRLTGSDDAPMRVGKNVRIKGTTYMFGCTLEDNVFVQNCYLFEKKIRFRADSNGEPIKVCHIFPKPGGGECVEDL